MDGRLGSGQVCKSLASSSPDFQVNGNEAFDGIAFGARDGFVVQEAGTGDGGFTCGARFGLLGDVASEFDSVFREHGGLLGCRSIEKRTIRTGPVASAKGLVC